LEIVRRLTYIKFKDLYKWKISALYFKAKVLAQSLSPNLVRKTALIFYLLDYISFSALTLLVGRHEEHATCKN